MLAAKLFFFIILYENSDRNWLSKLFRLYNQQQIYTNYVVVKYLTTLQMFCYAACLSYAWHTVHEFGVGLVTDVSNVHEA